MDAQKSRTSKIVKTELKDTKTIIEVHLEGFWVPYNALIYPMIYPINGQNQGYFRRVINHCGGVQYSPQTPFSFQKSFWWF